MHSDPYQTYIETLNSGEPYPPFGEIRDLVMQQNGRRKAAFVPFYKYAAVAALFAALGLFVGNHLLSNEPLQNTRITHGSTVTHESNVTHASHATDRPITPYVAVNARKSIAVGQETEKSASEKQNTSITPQHVIVDNASQPTTSQTIITPTAAPSVPATLAHISDQNGIAANHWSGFASGGSTVSSNNASISSIFAAAGVRYLLGGSSSLVVEFRRSSFVVNHSAQSGGFRDTTFSLGGVPYPNTIGSPSLPATTSTSQVNSLDVGYRFDLNPNDMLSPCVEVLAGASTPGFLSSESAGVEYRFANALSLDLSARAEQLFSPQSTPLTALGFEAGIAFEW
jgi:hypothetical protein